MALLRLQPPSLPLSGRRLELGELVGRGSRTTVHQAVVSTAVPNGKRTGGVRQRVIAKLFDAVPTDDSDGFLKGLEHAVARAALIQHPNVAQVHEHAVDAGRAYIVTEHVPGVSLADLMSTLANEGQRLTFDVALFVGCEVADALAGAFMARDLAGFRARVLHGDLSARQVMLGFTGSVKVTDFEIGRVSTGQSGVRSMRTVASHLEMLAPELVQGDAASPRTDVFALGMLLRTMFVGPRFPKGITHSDALRMVRLGEVDCPPFHARLPQELSELILTATAVNPDERFPNARILAWELRRIAFSHGVGDARPFLARALERSFPGESPFGSDADGDDDDLEDVWPEADDERAEVREHTSAEASAPEAHYDSEFPPARAAPARDATHSSFSVSTADRARLAFHDDDEPASSSGSRPRSSDRADDLARTNHLPALRPARLPETLGSHDDFDPEATVNLRDF